MPSALLLLFFFLSGACGLIYQVVWLRALGLIFGNTTFAVSTVVAGFMAGLGLGAFFFGRWIERHPKNPVRTYGWLEGGIGFYSLLTPFLWRLIEWIYVSYYRAFEPSFFHFSLLKFVLAFGFLFFPTFLMGGTLPVLTHYYASRLGRSSAAKSVGFLYAWNTLGAVTGVFFSGFFSLEVFGVWQTTVLAGFVNLFLFFFCFKLAAPPVQPEEPETSAVKTDNLETHGFFKARSLLILFGISGAMSMVYEVAWTRSLAMVLGSSVYAFSVMLATFLTGISLGSYLLSRGIKSNRAAAFLFPVMQILTAAFVLMGLNRFNHMPYDFVKLYESTGGIPWMMEAGKFLLSASVMILPTLLIGALFACFIRIYQQGLKVSSEVGTAYFSNTVGNILGSFLTGFYIIPWLGIQQTLISAAWINAGVGLLSALLLFSALSKRSAAVIGLLFLSLFAVQASVMSWDRTVMTSGAMVKPSLAKGLSRSRFMTVLKERELLFYREGTSATVSVVRLKDNLSLSVNGKVDASDGQDSFNQFTLGHLPLLLNPDAQKVMVIGLGSGASAAAVLSHDSVRSLEVVEIEPAVVKGAEFFKKLNRDYRNDSRVRVVLNDGRNHLLVSTQPYDIVISEPSNPWMAGVANLFSLEHYRVLKDRLTDSGIVCQWLHAYSMAPEDLRMIIRTFLTVFPDSELWTTYYPDLILIGHKKTGPGTVLKFDRFSEEFMKPAVLRDFQKFGFPTPESFLSSYWLGAEELRRFSEGGRIDRDSKPYLEFSAPRNLYRDTVRSNYELLNRYRKSKFPPLTGMKPSPDHNVKFLSELAKGFVAHKRYREAQEAIEKALSIEPSNPAVYESLGMLLFELGEFERARGFLAKAIQTDPARSSSAYYTLGLIEAKYAKCDEALVFLKRAIEMAPQTTVYLKGFAETFQKCGKPEAALMTYERLLQKGDGSFEIMSAMLGIYFQTRPLREQLAFIDRFLSRYPKSYSAYEKVGRELEQKQMFSYALRIYERLRQIFPDEGRVYLLLARTYSRMGDPEKAKVSLETAFRKSPVLKALPEAQNILKKER